MKKTDKSNLDPNSSDMKIICRPKDYKKYVYESRATRSIA